MSFRKSFSGGETAGKRRGGKGKGSYGGPKLPAVLMEQVDAKYGSRGRRDTTRKEKRKAARNDRRRPSQSYDLSRDENSNQDDLQNDEQPPVKRIKIDKMEERKPKKEERKQKLPELKLLEDDGDVEDREIEWLEYMLQKERKKSKDKEEGFDLDDGLEDLLSFTDTLGKDNLKRSKRELDSDADGEETSVLDDDVASDDGEEDKKSNEHIVDLKEDQEFRGFDVQSETGFQSSSSSHSKVDGVDAGDNQTPEASQILIGEDATSKYIPPHLRAKALEKKALCNKQKAEGMLKLERKAQGLLNRLSEQNLESIITEIECLYRDYSRHDVTTTITDLVIQMIANKANLLDSFVVLYATLVGALHRVVGIEFGAHFVHTLIVRYTSLSSPDNTQKTTNIKANLYEPPDAGKEGLNLLTLVTELYNAQVIGSRLIYDLIHEFLEAGGEGDGVMGEREVEGLLKILRCSGDQLRTDDPASLKDIVNLVQEKTKGKEQSMTVRARFMIETLTNVKNGKVKSNTLSEAGNQAVARMKKYLTGLGRKRRLLAYEPLRIPLNDLLDADKRGKWWLVGAAWSGNPLVELREQRDVHKETMKKDQDKVEDEDFNQALLEMARKQGINTDVRRGVFAVLMTSEDYMHACNRLNMLKLSSIQQREFVRIALHCCGLEKNYNPYYTLILSNLCQNSYDHRFTFQYALWDFMRQLENGENGEKEKIGNVAKAVGYIIARGGLDLTIFKAVDFMSSSKGISKFLITTIIHLLISLQTPSPVFSLPKSFTFSSNFDDEIVVIEFTKCLSNTELAGGWLWILDKKMGNNNWEEGVGERECEVVREGLNIAKKVLGRATGI
ncbi:uncharacterized protein L203_104384 [Cryptococcus depauperatus CBS 7841]|uniref:MI domain-containing protein n=1 Tax=Cryptococcus depauperatus CBS 7841 TaxID=1295531 RepID=A0AAJ8JVF0_9TREE